MGNCSQCNTFMLFGGVTRNGQRYCGENCSQRAQLSEAAEALPEREVRKLVWDTYKGTCPCCGGEGPVDVRMSYRVFSALVITRWTTHPTLGCRACGVKAQLASLLFCTVLGWWGFPWGFLITPLQIIRNLIGMLSGDSGTPSDALEKLVRLNLAAQLAAVPQAPEQVIRKAG